IPHDRGSLSGTTRLARSRVAPSSQHYRVCKTAAPCLVAWASARPRQNDLVRGRVQHPAEGEEWDARRSRPPGEAQRYWQHRDIALLGMKYFSGKPDASNPARLLNRGVADNDARDPLYPERRPYGHPCRERSYLSGHRYDGRYSLSR